MKKLLVTTAVLASMLVTPVSAQQSLLDHGASPQQGATQSIQYDRDGRYDQRDRDRDNGRYNGWSNRDTYRNGNGYNYGDYFREYNCRPGTRFSAGNGTFEVIYGQMAGRRRACLDRVRWERISERDHRWNSNHSWENRRVHNDGWDQRNRTEYNRFYERGRHSEDQHGHRERDRRWERNENRTD